MSLTDIPRLETGFNSGTDDPESPLLNVHSNMSEEEIKAAVLITHLDYRVPPDEIAITLEDFSQLSGKATTEELETMREELTALYHEHVEAPPESNPPIVMKQMARNFVLSRAAQVA
jgi:hypothetical protein